MYPSIVFSPQFYEHSNRAESQTIENDFLSGTLYKSAKVDANGDVSSNRATAVEDGFDEQDEAGPELPPDFNPDEDIPDDEEGRFFGGGISRDTAGAMDFVEKLDQGDPGVSITKSDFLSLLIRIRPEITS